MKASTLAAMLETQCVGSAVGDALQSLADTLKADATNRALLTTRIASLEENCRGLAADLLDARARLAALEKALAAQLRGARTDLVGVLSQRMEALKLPRLDRATPTTQLEKQCAQDWSLPPSVKRALAHWPETRWMAELLLQMPELNIPFGAKTKNWHLDITVLRTGPGSWYATVAGKSCELIPVPQPSLVFRLRDVQHNLTVDIWVVGEARDGGIQLDVHSHRGGTLIRHECSVVRFDTSTQGTRD